MKTKNIVAVWLVAFILTSCIPTAEDIPTETMVPTSTFTSDNWREYSSKFTSSVVVVQYSLRYPQGWYVYPGSTRSDPGLEGQTYIQDFVRIGEVGGDTSDYQVAGTVRLEIYALPCKITDEPIQGCDTTGLPTIVSNLSGVRKIENRANWTGWTVFLYTKTYRISLEGYMIGTPEQNADLIKILDAILSTVNVR